MPLTAAHADQTLTTVGRGVRTGLPSATCHDGDNITWRAWGLHGGTIAGVDPYARGVHLVGGRSAARGLQAVRVQPGDPAVAVLRRLDCVLEPTKNAVVQRAAALVAG